MTTILIVEDNEMNRDMLSRRLERKGYQILIAVDGAMGIDVTRAMLEKEGWVASEAGNGIEALRSMEHYRPRLIFLDLMMPGLDGFEFAAEVRRHPEWRSIPIVVITAQDLTKEDRRRLNGHVEKILRKDGDSRESLLEQVRDLLAGSNAIRAPREHAEALTP